MHSFARIYRVQLGHNLRDVILFAVLVSEYPVTTSGSTSVKRAAEIPELPVPYESQLDSASPSIPTIRDYLVRSSGGAEQSPPNGL